MSQPKRLIIEFEDGSKKILEFNQLKKEVWLGLSKMRLCSPPPALSELSDHYLLLKWKDGWQEVVGIKKKNVELLRYYTIERTEEVGRMALEVGEEYPVLFLIKRLPRQIEGLWVIGERGERYYSFAEGQMVKEGGKIEHPLYDKKNPNLLKENSQRPETQLVKMMDAIKEEIKKGGFRPQEILEMDLDHRVEKYKEWSKALGVTAMEKQEDLYGFMQLLLMKLGEAEG